jgi:hypothetical protein
MISLSELNPKGSLLTPSQEANLNVLLERINIIRKAWAKPMIVTSGFRSKDDHKRIYAQLAKRRGVEYIRIPMGSLHLAGAAVDISDPDGSLMEWCKCNEPLLEVTGLWMEEPDDQKRCHFQISPPRSGKRFFKP